MVKLNMDKLNKEFSECYKWLYDSEIELSGSDIFDLCLKNLKSDKFQFRKTLNQFVTDRCDPVSSDREATSFVMAYILALEEALAD